MSPGPDLPSPKAVQGPTGPRAKILPRYKWAQGRNGLRPITLKPYISSYPYIATSALPYTHYEIQVKL
jgi:hypothetical protein